VAYLFAMMMAVVAAYSGVRVLAPAWGDSGHARGPALTGVPGHPRDVQAWHGVMGGCMAAMLVTSLPGGFSRVAFAVFAACSGWCVVQMARSISRGVYLRLGVCSAAMLAMLPAQASAPSAPSMPGMTGMTGMPGMASSPPTQLAIVLIVALVCVGVAATTRLASFGSTGHRGGRVVPRRLESACEVAMAVAMVYMLGSIV